MAQPRQLNLTLRQCTRMRLKANSGARKSRSLELDCPSPPPAPPPQGRKPLPVAHSPVLRPASPRQIPQPQGGTPSPRAPLSPGCSASTNTREAAIPGVVPGGVAPQPIPGRQLYQGWRQMLILVYTSHRSCLYQSLVLVYSR